MEYPPAPGGLSVLWEDEDFLVVHKPPAMPVHPSPGHDRDSLLNRVAYHYQSTGQSHRVRPLYRLDRTPPGCWCWQSTGPPRGREQRSATWPCARGSSPGRAPSTSP